MAKEFLGDACAFIPGPQGEGKNKYYRIGSAYRDGERISFKIDTLPLAGSSWEGWVNVFPRGLQDNNPRSKSPSASHLSSLMDDDLPF